MYSAGTLWRDDDRGLATNLCNFKIKHDKRSKIYPSDVLIISFDDFDDVQLAISKSGKVYIECLDEQGNTKKIVLGDSRVLF